MAPAPAQGVGLPPRGTSPPLQAASFSQAERPVSPGAAQASEDWQPGGAGGPGAGRGDTRQDPPRGRSAAAPAAPLPVSASLAGQGPTPQVTAFQAGVMQILAPDVLQAYPEVLASKRSSCIRYGDPRAEAHPMSVQKGIDQTTCVEICFYEVQASSLFESSLLSCGADGPAAEQSTQGGGPVSGVAGAPTVLNIQNAPGPSSAAGAAGASNSLAATGSQRAPSAPKAPSALRLSLAPEPKEDDGSVSQAGPNHAPSGALFDSPTTGPVPPFSATSVPASASVLGDTLSRVSGAPEAAPGVELVGGENKVGSDTRGETAAGLGHVSAPGIVPGRVSDLACGAAKEASRGPCNQGSRFVRTTHGYISEALAGTCSLGQALEVFFSTLFRLIRLSNPERYEVPSVAIELPLSYAQEFGTERMFLSARSIVHSILPIRLFWPSFGDKRFVFITPSIPGRSLQGMLQRLEGQRLGEQAVFNIATDIVSGLLYLHENGFCLRNLSPENVLINTLVVGARIFTFAVFARQLEFTPYLDPEIFIRNLCLGLDLDRADFQQRKHQIGAALRRWIRVVLELEKRARRGSLDIRGGMAEITEIVERTELEDGPVSASILHDPLHEETAGQEPPTEEPEIGEPSDLSWPQAGSSKPAFAQGATVLRLPDRAAQGREGVSGGVGGVPAGSSTEPVACVAVEAAPEAVGEAAAGATSEAALQQPESREPVHSILRDPLDPAGAPESSPKPACPPQPNQSASPAAHAVGPSPDPSHAASAPSPSFPPVPALPPAPQITSSNPTPELPAGQGSVPFVVSRPGGTQSSPDGSRDAPSGSRRASATASPQMSLSACRAGSQVSLVRQSSLIEVQEAAALVRQQEPGTQCSQLSQAMHHPGAAPSAAPGLREIFRAYQEEYLASLAGATGEVPGDRAEAAPGDRQGQEGPSPGGTDQPPSALPLPDPLGCFSGGATFCSLCRPVFALSEAECKRPDGDPLGRAGEHPEFGAISPAVISHAVSSVRLLQGGDATSELRSELGGGRTSVIGPAGASESVTAEAVGAKPIELGLGTAVLQSEAVSLSCGETNDVVSLSLQPSKAESALMSDIFQPWKQSGGDRGSVDHRTPVSDWVGLSGAEAAVSVAEAAQAGPRASVEDDMPRLAAEKLVSPSSPEVQSYACDPSALRAAAASLHVSPDSRSTVPVPTLRIPAFGRDQGIKGSMGEKDAEMSESLPGSASGRFGGFLCSARLRSCPCRSYLFLKRLLLHPDLFQPLVMSASPGSLVQYAFGALSINGEIPDAFEAFEASVSRVPHCAHCCPILRELGLQGASSAASHLDSRAALPAAPSAAQNLASQMTSQLTHDASQLDTREETSVTTAAGCGAEWLQGGVLAGPWRGIGSWTGSTTDQSGPLPPPRDAAAPASGLGSGAGAGSESYAGPESDREGGSGCVPICGCGCAGGPAPEGAPEPGLASSNGRDHDRDRDLASTPVAVFSAIPATGEPAARTEVAPTGESRAATFTGSEASVDASVDRAERPGRGLREGMQENSLEKRQGKPREASEDRQRTSSRGSKSYASSAALAGIRSAENSEAAAMGAGAVGPGSGAGTTAEPGDRGSWTLDSPPSGVAGDIYSLGMTLLALATSCEPYSTQNCVLRGVLLDQRPPELDQVEDDNFWDLIAWCISPDASQRPASLKDVIRHKFFLDGFHGRYRDSYNGLHLQRVSGSEELADEPQDGFRGAEGFAGRIAGRSTRHAARLAPRRSADASASPRPSRVQDAADASELPVVVGINGISAVAIGSAVVSTTDALTTDVGDIGDMDEAENTNTLGGAGKTGNARGAGAVGSTDDSNLAHTWLSERAKPASSAQRASFAGLERRKKTGIRSACSSRISRSAPASWTASPAETFRRSSSSFNARQRPPTPPSFIMISPPAGAGASARFSDSGGSVGGFSAPQRDRRSQDGQMPRNLLNRPVLSRNSSAGPVEPAYPAFYERTAPTPGPRQGVMAQDVVSPPEYADPLDPSRLGFNRGDANVLDLSREKISPEASGGSAGSNGSAGLEGLEGSEGSVGSDLVSFPRPQAQKRWGAPEFSGARINFLGSAQQGVAALHTARSNRQGRGSYGSYSPCVATSARLPNAVRTTLENRAARTIHSSRVTDAATDAYAGLFSRETPHQDADPLTGESLGSTSLRHTIPGASPRGTLSLPGRGGLGDIPAFLDALNRNSPRLTSGAARGADRHSLRGSPRTSLSHSPCPSPAQSARRAEAPSSLAGSRRALCGGSARESVRGLMRESPRESPHGPLHSLAYDAVDALRVPEPGASDSSFSGRALKAPFGSAIDSESARGEGLSALRSGYSFLKGTRTCSSFEHSPRAKRAIQRGYRLHSRRASRAHGREPDGRRPREELATSAILISTDPPEAAQADIGEPNRASQLLQPSHPQEFDVAGHAHRRLSAPLEDRGPESADPALKGHAAYANDPCREKAAGSADLCVEDVGALSRARSWGGSRCGSQKAFQDVPLGGLSGEESSALSGTRPGGRQAAQSHQLRDAHNAREPHNQQRSSIHGECAEHIDHADHSRYSESGEREAPSAPGQPRGSDSWDGKWREGEEPSWDASPHRLSESLFDYDANGLRIQSVELRNCRPSTATLVLHMVYHYGDSIERTQAILMNRPPLETVESLISQKLIDASTDRMGLAEQIRQKIEAAKLAMASAQAGSATQLVQSTGHGSSTDLGRHQLSQGLPDVGEAQGMPEGRDLRDSREPRDAEAPQAFPAMSGMAMSQVGCGEPKESGEPEKADGRRDDTAVSGPSAFSEPFGADPFQQLAEALRATKSHSSQQSSLASEAVDFFSALAQTTGASETSAAAAAAEAVNPAQPVADSCPSRSATEAHDRQGPADDSLEPQLQVSSPEQFSPR